jgi:hypothetical protein
MPMKIGPSFVDELRAAGVEDFRFSWGAEGKSAEDLLEFHPGVPESERQKVLDVLAAHDSALSEARHQALQGTDAEAGRRISEMFGKSPADAIRVIHKQLNTVGRAIQILDRKIEGTALPEERAVFQQLDRIYNRVQAILDVETRAQKALEAAKNVEEVEAVKPAWPAKD